LKEVLEKHCYCDGAHISPMGPTFLRTCTIYHHMIFLFVGGVYRNSVLVQISKDLFGGCEVSAAYDYIFMTK